MLTEKEAIKVIKLYIQLVKPSGDASAVTAIKRLTWEPVFEKATVEQVERAVRRFAKVAEAAKEEYRPWARTWFSSGNEGLEYYLRDDYEDLSVSPSTVPDTRNKDDSTPAPPEVKAGWIRRYKERR